MEPEALGGFMEQFNLVLDPNTAVRIRDLAEVVGGGRWRGGGGNCWFLAHLNSAVNSECFDNAEGG